MTEAELRALGETRRLVFQNIANGLPHERVMADMCLSQLDVDQALRFVSRKITQYLVLRRQAPVACEGVAAIRHNRLRLLPILSRMGDLDLSTDLILSKITVQTIDHPEMIEGVSRRMSEAYQ